MIRPATPGVGHNRPPGSGWARYCWGRSRKELLGKRIPLEILKLRVKRAEALGLDYPRYASILRSSGRDIIGFLFTVDGLYLRLRRRLQMPDHAQARLSRIDGADLMALAPEGEAPAEFLSELRNVAGVPIRAAGRMPPEGATWGRARAEILDLLRDQKTPPDGIVLIGAADEIPWAEAARLAAGIERAEFHQPHILSPDHQRPAQ